MTPSNSQAGSPTGRRLGLFGLWRSSAARDTFSFAVDMPGVGVRDAETGAGDGFHEICSWLGEHCQGPYTTRALIVDGRPAGRTFVFVLASDAAMLRDRMRKASVGGGES